MLMWFSDLRLIGIFIICFHWLCCMFLLHSVPIFKAFWHTVDRVSGWLAHLHCVAAVRNISNRVTRVFPVLFLFCKPSCVRYATSNNPSVFFHHQWWISSHSSLFFSIHLTHISYSASYSHACQLRGPVYNMEWTIIYWLAHQKRLFHAPCQFANPWVICAFDRLYLHYECMCW